MKAIGVIAIPAVARRLRGEGWSSPRFKPGELERYRIRARIMECAIAFQADHSAVVQQLFPFRDRERA